MKVDLGGNKVEKMTLEEKCIDTIRCLSIDAVEKAGSGHPGTPMALAPVAYVLWMEHLNFNPQNPEWINRDRFVLSNGHASMLQYAILYLTGYDISLDDLKQFRQWGSITPGHPENQLTPGIETTTGPLGQGLMNAVGMAVAEAHLASLFNKEGHKIIDHYTYVFCGDGDLMEGASHEAASFAGQQGLGKLIALYDDNHITIEGKTELTYNDNVKKRFEAYHWHVIELGEEANNPEAISKAFTDAKAVTDKPSMIILRTHIGYGSPHKQDTPEAHGSPLGDEEVKLTKEFYGWPTEPSFLVPQEVLEYTRRMIDKGVKKEDQWKELWSDYEQKYPEMARQFNNFNELTIPDGWDSEIPVYKPADGPKATRSVSSDVLNAIYEKLPWLLGGSADLSPSTKTLFKASGYFEKNNRQNRNIAWGIREMGMCAISSGIYLHGGLRAFASTFFVFTDYARPAIRLAALMRLPSIFVMTHDSIGLGEDGPTHQPIEHLASFRAMPHLYLIRPADANEAAEAWKAAVRRTEGPTMLVLTRQKLPVLDRTKYSAATGLHKGAYIVSKEKGDIPDIILIGTGSEVQLLLEAQEQLAEENIAARVVSMPCWELFRDQGNDYRESVLPKNVKARLAVETGAPSGWHEWIGDRGDIIGITRFGSSAPYKENFKHYGFTVEHVIEKAKKLISKL